MCVCVCVCECKRTCVRACVCGGVGVVGCMFPVGENAYVCIVLFCDYCVVVSVTCLVGK